MGKRGPAPTPTALLSARGSWRAKRNPDEPIGFVGAPSCPKSLSKSARGIWAAVLKTIPIGVLTRDNGETLARYCHMLARWWKLARWIDRHAETYSIEDDKGNKRIFRHPNLITYETLTKDLLRLEQEFGLTPSARTRIHMALSEDSDRPARRPELPRSSSILRIAP